MSEAPWRRCVAVTRAEFDLLCEVVELALGLPGGVADQAHHLSWHVRDVLEMFARYRHDGVAVFGSSNAEPSA